MMPSHIFLVRHAESQRDRSAALGEVETPLTEEGRQQAQELGDRIAAAIGDQGLAAFISPYLRAQETYAFAAQRLPPPLHVEMDLRLAEQVWGLSPKFERFAPRTFFRRPELGESTADVYARVGTFINDLKLGALREGWPNIALFSHGLVLRLFLMHWLHWSLEEFESLENTRPGDMFVLQRLGEGARYRIVSPLKVKGDAVLPVE